MNGIMTYTLEDLARDQEELRIDRFDYEFAWRLGSAMREKAASQELPVIITIAHGTDVVFSVLMPGATADNIDWAMRKRAVSWRFHRSSLAMRLEAEKGKFEFNARYRLPESGFVASGGGVPLILRNGTIIGTAGVSGLMDTEDHKLIIECLKKLQTT
jgi:uncharacterized protein (UPF0303 family)